MRRSNVSESYASSLPESERVVLRRRPNGRSATALLAQNECALEMADAIERSKNGLLAFTCYTMPIYEVNWHHLSIAKELNKFVTGETTRLIISCPPRMGKSELVSRRLPAYVLGRNPNEKVIACSYSADLSSRNSRDVQRVIECPEYKHLFPNTKLRGPNARSESTVSALRRRDAFEVVNFRGEYKSAGVGGPITGSGCTLGLIDDPIKSQADAMSKTVRDNIWEWYNSTFYSRLEKDARICVVMTRWHMDDLVGRLLKKAEEDPEAEQWRYVVLPATKVGEPTKFDPREEGEPLWPSKYSVKRMKKMRTTMGERAWSALYQQSPSPPEGAILKRQWWRFFSEMPSDLCGHLIAIDTTFKDKAKNDFVVAQVWCTRRSEPSSRYILQSVRARMDYVAFRAMVRNLAGAWPQIREFVVEDTANGAALISDLRKEIAGLVPFQPVGSKIARAEAVSPQLEAGNVYVLQPSLWAESLIEECAAFPHGEHDDQVDAMSMALLRMGQRFSSRHIAQALPRSVTKKSQWNL